MNKFFYCLVLVILSISCTEKAIALEKEVLKWMPKSDRFDNRLDLKVKDDYVSIMLYDTSSIASSSLIDKSVNDLIMFLWDKEGLLEDVDSLEIRYVLSEKSAKYTNKEGPVVETYFLDKSKLSSYLEWQDNQLFRAYSSYLNTEITGNEKGDLKAIHDVAKGVFKWYNSEEEPIDILYAAILFKQKEREISEENFKIYQKRFLYLSALCFVAKEVEFNHLPAFFEFAESLEDVDANLTMQQLNALGSKYLME